MINFSFKFFKIYLDASPLLTSLGYLGNPLRFDISVGSFSRKKSKIPAVIAGRVQNNRWNRTFQILCVTFDAYHLYETHSLKIDGI